MTARNREEQARDEIARHRRFIESAGPAEDFASQFARGQLEARIDELEGIIRGEMPRLDVVLGGEEAEQHRVPAELLGRLIRRLQQGITRIGWAFQAGATDEREPPVAIKRLTSFDVVAFSPSSFRITLQRPMTTDLMAQQLELDVAPELAEMSVGAFMELVGRAQDQSLDEEAEELAHRIGQASAKSVQRLMGDLAQSNMVATFDWRGDGEARAIVTPETAKGLGDWLRSVEERTRPIEVRGTLHGGDDLVGNFKLVDAAENVYEGKADPEILAGKTFGETYIAALDEVTSVADHIGTTTQKYVLRSLRRVDEVAD